MDDVFCCLGTTLKQAGSRAAFRRVDYVYCIKLAELAQINQVGHFLIVTAVNVNSRSVAYYSKVKGQLQNDIKKLGLNRVSIFQPSLLLGERTEFRMAELFAGKVSGLLNRMLPKRLSKYKAIQASVVAKAMVRLASRRAADFEVSLKQATPTMQYFHFDDMQSLSHALLVK